MTPAEIAALQARAYRHGEAAWSERAVAELVQAPGTVVAFGDGGFAIGRVVAGEAELLALAVDPASQRQGRGAALLSEFVDACACQGCTAVFLEVAATNAPAVSLYLAGGFAEVGRRPEYYRGDGAPSDALILRKDLS